MKAITYLKSYFNKENRCRAIEGEHNRSRAVVAVCLSVRVILSFKTFGNILLYLCLKVGVNFKKSLYSFTRQKPELHLGRLR